MADRATSPVCHTIRLMILRKGAITSALFVLSWRRIYHVDLRTWFNIAAF